jgi:hypothetical protein
MSFLPLGPFQNPDPDSESGFTFPEETGFGAAKYMFFFFTFKKSQPFKRNKKE